MIGEICGVVRLEVGRPELEDWVIGERWLGIGDRSAVFGEICGWLGLEVGRPELEDWVMLN